MTKSAADFSTLIIANPKSGGGKSKWLGKRLKRLVRETLPHAELVWTSRAGEGTELAKNGRKRGYEMIVAAGGDGTVAEVLNGLLEFSTPPVLGIIPLGTGSDFLRALKWRPYLKPAVARLAGKKTMACDVGSLSYTTVGGAMAARYFLNMADIGMGFDMMKRVNRFPKIFGAPMANLQGFIRTWFAYQKRYLEIIVDDHHKGSRLVTNIFVGNGVSNAGGWRFCPDARLDDGLFDITIIGNVGIDSFFKTLPAIYRGERIDHPEVSYYRGKRLRVLSGKHDPVGVEADGEPLGYLPAEFHNLHHKIRLKI